MIIPIIVIAILAFWGKQLRILILKPHVEKSALYMEYLEKQKSYKSLLETKMTLNQFNDSTAKIQGLAANHFTKNDNITNMASSHFANGNRKLELSDDYLDD